MSCPLIPFPHEQPSYESLLANWGRSEKAKTGYLKALRLQQLARWSGATGIPMKPEGKRIIHASPEALAYVDGWRREGEAMAKVGLFGMAGRYYFAARFAVTPYAIPDGRRT